MANRHLVVAGGTGFVGGALVEALIRRGDQVTIATRNPDRVSVTGARACGYGALPDDPVDGVVNLAGASIFGRRWNEAYKQELRTSRVDLTAGLVSALAKRTPRPRVLINSSAVGIYGDAGDAVLGEDATQRDNGFLGRLCQDWEQAALAAKDHGIRTVVLRTGIVLARDGGALQQMEPPFRWFVGGPIGDGKQYMPWIHREDLVGMILWALDHDAADGVFNATAPAPVTNAAFSRALARRLGRPAFLRVPVFALKLRFGEVGQHLAEGQRAVPNHALAAGFEFRYADCDAALDALYGPH